MNVCIVGHGPSLKTARLGKEIDACDVVVRLKNCSMLLAEPQNYGKRTDVMCSSTEVMHHLHKIPAKEYWGYPKKGHYNQASVWQLSRKVGFAPVHVPLEVVNLWNEFFRSLGAKHQNVSTGVGALIIALDRYKPEVVYLAGFDKIWSPETEGYQCTVPTLFNAGGTKDTGHDWGMELTLLSYLAAHYGSRIADLAGLHDVQPSGLRTVRKDRAAIVS